jgi:hypothetical protein
MPPHRTAQTRWYYPSCGAATGSSQSSSTKLHNTSASFRPGRRGVILTRRSSEGKTIFRADDYDRVVLGSLGASGGPNTSLMYRCRQRGFCPASNRELSSTTLPLPYDCHTLLAWLTDGLCVKLS